MESGREQGNLAKKVREGMEIDRVGQYGGRCLKSSYRGRDSSRFGSGDWRDVKRNGLITLFGGIVDVGTRGERVCE